MSRLIATGFLRTAFLLLAALSSLPALAAPSHADFTPPYEVQVVIDGMPVREYVLDGRYFVEGMKGRRYSLRLINHTGRRVEVVATVDGLDVIDGKAGDFVRKRGYVLGPWQTYDVEGFRLDMGRVAAFRFSSVAGSYAARTGSARNVGVIGVAFFEERLPMRVSRPRPVRPQEEREAWYGDRANGPSWDEADARAETAPADMSAPRSQARGGGLGGLGTASTAQSAPALDSLASERAGAKYQRPGLGTAFGESRHSDVVDTTFLRADGVHPNRLVTLRYDDRDGLRAQGVPVDPPSPSDTFLRATANPFPAVPHPRHFAEPPCGWRQ